MAWIDSVDILNLQVSRDAESSERSACVLRAPLRRLRVAANQFAWCGIGGQVLADQDQGSHEQPGGNIKADHPAKPVGNHSEGERREPNKRAQKTQIRHVDTNILLFRSGGDVVR